MKVGMSEDQAVTFFLFKSKKNRLRGVKRPPQGRRNWAEKTTMLPR